MGVSINGRIQKWLLIMKNPNLKWMMTGGSPMTQETTISVEQWPQKPSVIPLNPGWLSSGLPVLGLL